MTGGKERDRGCVIDCLILLEPHLPGLQKKVQLCGLTASIITAMVSQVWENRKGRKEAASSLSFGSSRFCFWAKHTRLLGLFLALSGHPVLTPQLLRPFLSLREYQTGKTKTKAGKHCSLVRPRIWAVFVCPLSFTFYSSTAHTALSKVCSGETLRAFVRFSVVLHPCAREKQKDL